MANFVLTNVDINKLFIHQL